ncbi:MAG: glutathione S-transferase family protein [Pseudomonadota bacterium]
MISIYYARTPNGMKPLLFTMEHGIEADYHFVDLSNREQFAPEFLAISPNNKIPAMTDGDLKLFESGVILEYLADQHLDFKSDPHRYEILKWLYWQVGGLGPMGGQNHFFREFAPEPIPFAIDRYTNECKRLYGVLDGHLAEREFIGGAGYHIADMAIYPWIWYHEMHHVPIEAYPNVQRWFEGLTERPSVKMAYERFFHG